MINLPPEYLLYVALGLGGAALYHLGSVFLYWITLGYEADASFRKMVNQNVDLTLSLSKASGLHKVNIDALYERVEALEEHDTLWVFEKTQPLVTFGKAPYSSGKPCPKPTKDLRPGDEVALRAVVRSVHLNDIEFEDPVLKMWMSRYSLKDVDIMRTDNK